MKSFIMVALLLAISATASAQEVPKVELFGGYSYAGGNFHGLDTSLTWNINKWFGITANFSGHYGGETNGVFVEHQRALSFLGGPRFTLRKSKRFAPFAYALLGAVNYIHETKGFFTLSTRLTIGHQKPGIPPALQTSSHPSNPSYAICSLDHCERTNARSHFAIID